MVPGCGEKATHNTLADGVSGSFVERYSLLSVPGSPSD